MRTADLVQNLAKLRTIFLMVPAATVDALIAELTPLLEDGDTLIDGGNSHYHDDITRAKRLSSNGIDYLDSSSVPVDSARRGMGS